ncbi:MAG: NlpC/P60 family protein [Clostridium sp.]|nr:NlpC/P60 family protein [Acetatifactor muris]MCM1527940.1 NlpC/P60 family protein [Bacteroides sp.]MCM1564134.1 NlpC/P60 family protein [Clostridium sp.]
MTKDFGTITKGIRLVATGMACCMLLDPLTVSAAETGGNLLAAGVGSVFETNLTAEDYLEIAEQARGASWGYTNIGIANVESGNLNVRAVPAMDGKLVGKMPKDSACEVLEVLDGWAHIQSGEVEGYVSTDYLFMGPDAKLKAGELVRTVAVANVDNLNVRDEADTNSAVMTQVLKGEELDFVEDMGDWIQVSLDGEPAYVSAEYVDVQEKLGTAITMTELLYGQGVSDIRVDVVEYAKQFLGNPYVWGGTSLTKGADCSGFVQSVFKKFGVKLSRTSSSQAGDGTKISASELLPGDLVFYANSSGTINHVAIYIGGGRVIHASNPKSGIKISQYNYRTPKKCVRVLYD